MKTLLAMGSDHQSEVSMIAGNLGGILGSLSRFEEAREYLEYSLEVSRKANGGTTLDDGACLYNNRKTTLNAV